jgi:hypothetical protein
MKCIVKKNTWMYSEYAKTQQLVAYTPAILGGTSKFMQLSTNTIELALILLSNFVRAASCNFEWVNMYL